MGYDFVHRFNKRGRISSLACCNDCELARTRPIKKRAKIVASQAFIMFVETKVKLIDHFKMRSDRIRFNSPKVTIVCIIVISTVISFSLCYCSIDFRVPPLYGWTHRGRLRIAHTPVPRPSHTSNDVNFLNDIMKH